jgi:triphosphoribosyl-dephospho-CoA synthase
MSSEARGVSFRRAGPRPGCEISVASAVGYLAFYVLMQELLTWPKPGLVSHVDSGSHRDMNAHMLGTSAARLRPYFAELTLAGSLGADMGSLREIGKRAEAAMLEATQGVNTHRGAIFGLGLLCAAAGAAAMFSPQGAAITARKLGSTVESRWREGILRAPIDLRSHGADAFGQYGARGARGEAALGFPSIYRIGLPALRRGRTLARGDEAAARVQCIFALVARVADTNVLYRGGREGAVYASATAEDFLLAGGVGVRDWRQRAARAHAGFVSRRLSPGGCADLLAMTLFVDALDDGIKL